MAFFQIYDITSISPALQAMRYSYQYKDLDKYGDAWVVSLSIAKLFFKFWNVGLLHKLKCYGVS